MGNVIWPVIYFVTIVVMGAVCAVLVRRANRERDAAVREVADAKTKFLARVSNDIKTPMNAIIGTTALGMEEVDNPERVRRHLQEIDSASRFLMTLLNDLVDASKIELGRLRLHPKPYAFNEFLESMRTITETACKEKGVRFVMPEEDININVMVDSMRFSQLFVNLLSNAVKFTPAGGTVAFRVCNYAIHNNSFSADYIVEDTGVGMSEEFQKALFEPFTQTVSARAEERHGTGLGLVIVHNITELMGGTIEIASKPENGTHVKVHLELELAMIQPEKKTDHLKEVQIREILCGKRILLVEDHPLNVEVTKNILERQNMEVVCAENGAVAVRIFEEQETGYFDAILMDIFMPAMDGLEAARELRRTKKPDARVIPIIAMSAGDSYEDVVACKEAGMDAHLAKPVEPQQLYQVLCEYLQAPV